MKYFICFCIASLALLGSSCVTIDARLVIVNRTDNPLAPDTFLDTIPNYPKYGDIAYYKKYIVPPGDSIKLVQHMQGGWPAFVRRSHNSNLQLFTYDENALNSGKALDYLIRNKKYAHYSYSIEFLKRNNWHIILK